MIITSPTEARKGFYQLLKNVNNNHEPIYISGNNAEIMPYDRFRRLEKYTRDNIS
ncbi:type II toxin-antitoxin system Phd/YefM family antitoxin [Staphylococcus aureus]